MAALGSTVLAFVLGLPAAFALAVYPTRRAKAVLNWMLSTKFMPAVGVIVPLFLLFKNLQLLDTLPGLILMYTTMNLPLVVWMMHSYMTEIPFAIYEAAKVDGASVGTEFFGIALPLAPAGGQRHRASGDHLRLERGVLRAEPDHLGRRAAERLHRLVQDV